MAMAGEKLENPGVEREGYRCPSFCTFGAGRRSAGMRRRLGQRPREARQTPILSYLTENRDRCEFHVATINPSASDPQGASARSARRRSTRAHDLGFDPRHACEPLEITDCAPAATQRTEARIGST